MLFLSMSENVVQNEWEYLLEPFWSQWWKISFNIVKFMTWEFIEGHQHKTRTKLLELYFECFYFCFRNWMFQRKVGLLLCCCTKLSENAWSDDFCLIVYILDSLTEIPKGPFLQPGQVPLHGILSSRSL